MEGLGFIRQPFQQLVVDTVLILLETIQLCQNFPLGNFQLIVSLLQSEELLDSHSEVALLLEVHLVKLPAILNAEKLSDLSQSFLSCAFEFLQDIFDAFYVLDLFVLGGLAFLDLAIEHIVVLLL